MIGQNVETKMVDGKLHLIIDPKEKGTPSASGKSQTIASTRGNVYVAECDLTIGVNAYRRK